MSARDAGAEPERMLRSDERLYLGCETSGECCKKSRIGGATRVTVGLYVVMAVRKVSGVNAGRRIAGIPVI